MKLSFRLRTWLAYIGLDLPFVPAVPVAFIAMNDLWRTDEVWIVVRWFFIVYIIKTILWSTLLFTMLSPVEAWIQKTELGTATDEDLKKAVIAANRFPYRFVGPWAFLWGVQYLIVFADRESLPVATEYPSLIFPFCVTVALAAGVFNLPFNSVLLAQVSGRMSLEMRRRRLHVPLWADSIRARLIFITLGIASSATGWMVCAGYTTEIRTNANELRLRGDLVREDVAERALRRVFAGGDITTADVEAVLDQTRRSEQLIHPFAIFDGKLLIDEQTGAKLRAHPTLLYRDPENGHIQVHDPRAHLAISAEQISDRLLVGAVIDVKPAASDLYLLGVCFFFIVVLIFSPMVAWLLGRSLSGPIQSIGHALQEITRRDAFTDLRRVPVFRPDELGVLAERANEMIDALERIWAQNSRHTVELREKNVAVEAAREELQKKNEALERARVALEKTNEDLVAAAKAKSQFLASMSHELRTPLNAIIGFSRMVMKKTQGMIPEQQTKNLALINESGQALLALVNDLLDFERIESGRLKLTIDEVDIDAMIASLQDTLQPAAEKKAMTLSATVTCGPLRMRTDPDRLRQVLINFINNAIKYSEKGHVQVTVSRDDNGDVLMAVKDEGVGIPADQLQKIFEPFHQVDGSFSREREGVGLGLAIVKKLVQALGGAVTVESTVGVGSTFTLRMPADLVVAPANATTPPATTTAAQPPPAPTAPPATHTPATPATPAASPPTPAQTVDVIVVEDDPATLALIEQHLAPSERPGHANRGGGFFVRRARSVDEARQAFDDHLPAAVVLDLALPGVDDGFRVLEDLRGRPGGAACHVVVFTARDLGDDEANRLRAHGATLVKKGDDGAELVSRSLKTMLRGRAPPG